MREEGGLPVASKRRWGMPFARVAQSRTTDLLTSPDVIERGSKFKNFDAMKFTPRFDERVVLNPKVISLNQNPIQFPA